MTTALENLETLILKCDFGFNVDIFGFVNDDLCCRVLAV